MLEIKDLSVSYGVIPVLRNVSLNVGKDEIVTLLGSNGSGKTTMLKTISGILRPTSGSIIFQGKHIENSPCHEIVMAGIAHVPEGRKIFPYMTVKENLCLGAYEPKAWKKKHDSLEWVFGLFPPLKERSNMEARMLSGGEQQMLVVGRGLMSRPRLLMIDEPSLGLGPKVLSEVYKVIKDLRREKIAILLSEQNARYALNVVDRGYVLQDGSIVLEGSSDELLESELVKRAYIGR